MSTIGTKAILKIYLVLIFCYAFPLLAQSAASADSVVPSVVKFAGNLNDGRGNPLTGTVGVTFLLYQEQSGGAPLWMETQNVQADKTGHYSVLLGSTKDKGVPASAFAAGEARWIGVQASGQAEQPRIEVVSVPYALKAADAQTLGGLPPSAFLLASQPGTAASATGIGNGIAQAAVGTTSVTTAGGTAQMLAKFDANADIANSQIFDNGTNVGIGTTAPTAKLDVRGSVTVRGGLTLPATSTATATTGRNSQPQSLTASAFNSSTKAAVNQNFRWQAEPVGNNTTSPSGKLNLLFGSGTASPAETGLSISNTGIIQFANGQTFPGGGGAGTVTSVGLAAPSSDFAVTGSPVTSSGTLNLAWLVPPTPNSTVNAIVKRDNAGKVSVNGITVTGGSVEAVNAGEGLGALMTNNLAFTPAVSGRSIATGDGSTHGVNGFSSTNQGAGIFGFSNGLSGAGVLGSNVTSGFGVLGEASGTSGFGVLGEATGPAGQGVWGESFGALVDGSGFGPDGVDGVAHSVAGSGVAAVNLSNGDGLFAQSNGGLAGFFLGKTEVAGDLVVTGNVSKSSGSFKIDHPLDPANKYLYHSFVESPDMKNIYDGTVTTDAAGSATVTLPDWFEALNRDFRYQLTVIGQFAQAIVASEMANHSFSIRTDRPHVKVSWQVTGIRQDAYANAHRIPVEEVKPDQERGLYLHPELFGAPAEKSVVAAHPHPAVKRTMEGRARPAIPSNP